MTTDQKKGLRYFPVFEKYLKESSTDFFLNKLSAADVAVFEIIDACVEYYGLDKTSKEILKNYPNILKLYNAVLKVGRVNEYLKERKYDTYINYCKSVKKTLKF